MSTPETRTNTVIAGFVAGNATVHALRRIGTYASGTPRYAKQCGTSRNDRHEPSPAPGATVTCKRCLAKLAARKGTTYTLKPQGLLDTTDVRVMRHAGVEVRKVQPAGCPRNGTMRQCYVERVDSGEFIGLVNEASLTERTPEPNPKEVR